MSATEGDAAVNDEQVVVVAAAGGIFNGILYVLHLRSCVMLLKNLSFEIVILDVEFHVILVREMIGAIIGPTVSQVDAVAAADWIRESTHQHDLASHVSQFRQRGIRHQTL